jgi:NAD(P)-dependent dehydrogenase (short-subunit alcohol dehydrogenase family)
MHVSPSISSFAHYANTTKSKLANVLFAKELDRRLANERIFCTAVHPGLVWTEIGRGFAQSYPYLNPFYRLASFIVTVPPYRGAISQLYAATAPEIEEKNMRCVEV